MNKILERMARAAYEQFNIGMESLEPSWDQCTEDFKFRMMEEQRFALKEIREPTREMLYAVGPNAIELAPSVVWKAMIDELLK